MLEEAKGSRRERRQGERGGGEQRCSGRSYQVTWLSLLQTSSPMSLTELEAWGMQNSRPLKETLDTTSLEDMTRHQVIYSPAGEQTSMHEGAIVTTCKLRPEGSGR